MKWIEGVSKLSKDLWLVECIPFLQITSLEDISQCNASAFIWQKKLTTKKASGKVWKNLCSLLFWRNDLKGFLLAALQEQHEKWKARLKTGGTTEHTFSPSGPLSPGNPVGPAGPCQSQYSP